MVILSGCTIEQKLANDFTDMTIEEEFLVLQPDYLLKYNLKTYEIPGIDSLDALSRDSVLLNNSLFLRELNDKEIISAYTASFIKALKTYNIKISPENFLDTLLKNKHKAVILNIAQFSIEEYVHPFSSEEYIDDEVIRIGDIDLNALNYNIWLEISYMNTEGDQKVLFASDYLLDDVNGTLKQYLFTNEMRFDYTIDTITPGRIYKFSADFGKTTAGYLYDFLMNRYIGEHLPEDYPYDRYYYHYDPAKGRPYPIDPEKRFIEIKK